VMFGSLFFAGFYPFTQRTAWGKTFFQICAALAGLLLLGYGLKWLLGGMGSYYLVVWGILRGLIVLVFLLHVFLVLHKIIPAYLGLAFLCPIAGHLAYIYVVPSVHDSFGFILFWENIFLAGIAVELLLMLVYVVQSFIRADRLYQSLRIEMQSMKTEFEIHLQTQEEQHRLSVQRELHDSFGAYFALLKMGFSDLKGSFSGERQRLKHLEGVLEEFYAEFRRALDGFAIPTMSGQELDQRLRDFVHRVENVSGVAIDYRQELPPHLTHQQALALLRAATELMGNALKHAHATRIELNLMADATHLRLTATDNGQGLGKRGSRGYGLDNLHQRAQELNGSLEVKSLSEQGLSVTFKLPLGHEETTHTSG
ncbi:MAG: hypothetical protein HC842_01140, partial [Cytophagales bacterium]|nr:hypothetical protein [Cytophagales bacterium]